MEDLVKVHLVRGPAKDPRSESGTVVPLALPGVPEPPIRGRGESTTAPQCAEAEILMDMHEPDQEKKQEMSAMRSANSRMMSLDEVALHFAVARSTVDQMPLEVLPYSDLAPAGKRQLKRYHPADVLAAPAHLREMRAEQQKGKLEEYLKRRRTELDERDRSVIELARGAREVAT